MLPIGVVLPTRNSAALLPDHLASMKSWLDLAQEVVVVDSHSTDGTFERLQAELRHPGLKLLQHPPGLYQSWNYGIGQLKAEYCYVSTVGESITREGLEHLAEVMRTRRCDVVISRPEFVDVHGRPMRASEWPVHDMIDSLRVREPIVLEGIALFLFTLLNYANAILGSSASNLYRTACLQANPFPVDYGTAGDGGWGLAHCVSIRLGVTARVFSTFREHPKSYTRAEYAVDQLSAKMFDRICRTYRETSQADARFAREAQRLQIESIIAHIESFLRWQLRLEECRARRLPWILNPAAWEARRQRDGQKREIAALKQAALPLLAHE